jgi:undecaprenyl-diphosphatase
MTSLESSLLLWFHDSLSCAFLDVFFRVFTQLGDNKVLAVLFLGQTAFFWLRRERFKSAASLGLGLSMFAAGSLLKAAIGRPRPFLWSHLVAAHGGAFPSGHALGAAACYAFLAWLLARAWPERRSTLWTGCAVVVFLVGFSRLYLGVHWPTDVAGGWALGAALAAGAVLLARRAPERAYVAGLDPPPVRAREAAEG